MDTHFVVVEAVWIPININVTIITLYAPQNVASKRRLWDSLIQLVVESQGEVILMGYFNEVRFDSERFRTQFCAGDAAVFNQFIADTDWGTCT